MRFLRDVTGTLSGPGMFRLALALLVYVDHTSRFSLGTTAVYVFFVLSGYWITVMWRGRYSRTRNPYAVYLVSRGWRLLPAFIACSAFTWLLLAATGRVPPGINWPAQVIPNLFIFGYKSLVFLPIGTAWSLDMEMQFYLVAPFLAAALMRNWWVLLASIPLMLVDFALDDTHTAISFLPYFLAGMTAASVNWKPSRGLGIGSLVAAVAAVLLCIASPWREILLAGAHRGPLFVYTPAANIVVALILVPWAIYTTRQPSNGRDRMFADLSYLVYLLHAPIIQAIDVASGGYAHRAGRILIGLVVSLGGAWLLWWLFDRPVNASRARWVSRMMLTKAAPAARPADDMAQP